MDLTNNIQANRKIVPKVYAYIIPDYPPNKGWVKIGDTTRDVETRIKEQTSTANVIAKRLWDQVARFNSSISGR